MPRSDLVECIEYYKLLTVNTKNYINVCMNE